MTWRDKARPIIAEVIKRVGKGDMKVLRKALREAYPWGLRVNHPYKMWCSEVKVQLGKATLGRTREEILGQRELF